MYTIKLEFIKVLGVGDFIKSFAEVQQQHITLTFLGAKSCTVESHNSFVIGNHVIHLLMLGNGSNDQTNRNR